MMHCIWNIFFSRSVIHWTQSLGVMKQRNLCLFWCRFCFLISDRTKGRKLSIDGEDDVPMMNLKPKPQVEYVKPVKISPLPLHEQDLLYGGDQWAFTSPVTSHTTQPTARDGRNHDVSQSKSPMHLCRSKMRIIVSCPVSSSSVCLCSWNFILEFINNMRINYKPSVLFSFKLWTSIKNIIFISTHLKIIPQKIWNYCNKQLVFCSFLNGHQILKWNSLSR